MFYLFLALLTGAIAGLDQWTKWLTARHIPVADGQTVVKAIPGLFHITHIKNTARPGPCWRDRPGSLSW